MTPHPPNERPQVYKRYFYVPLEKIVLFAVEPTMVRTTRRMRSENVDVRNCYSPSERHLCFYKHYTPHNCRMECLRNYTLLKCGCVKYSMLRGLNSTNYRLNLEKKSFSVCFTGTNGTKICGPGKIKCYKQCNRAEFRTVVLPACKCYPSCVQLLYNAEMTQTDFDYAHLYSNLYPKKSFGMKKYFELHKFDSSQN